MKAFVLLCCFVLAVHSEDLKTAETEYILKINKAVQKVYNSHSVYSNKCGPTPYNDNLPIVEFSCQVEASPSPPTDVHHLRPTDIQVVAALGDSISAGYGIGAETVAEVGIQRRGEVFTAGGDLTLEENVTTVVNILKKFNPNLQGYSTGVGGAVDENAWLNVAVGGARATHMLGQAEGLMTKIRADPRIDIDNSWKMVSLFIGGNDICHYCRFPGDATPALYSQRIQEALDHLHTVDPLPKTLVNLIVMFDMTPLKNLSTGPACDEFHQAYCDCAVDPTREAEMKKLQFDYFVALEDLVNSGRYDTRNDFTVVLQHQMRDITPYIDPETGYWEVDLLSKDCFHPSRKFHYGMAVMLWDTLLTPVPEKVYGYTPETFTGKLRCPTQERPYIYTRHTTPPAAKAQEAVKVKQPENRWPNLQQTINKKI